MNRIQTRGAFLLLALFSFAFAGQAELTEVTLEIDGLICSACVHTVEDALKAVKGVEEAEVSLNASEAVIRYDSSKCGVDDLIKALDQAQGINLYEARVKKEKSE